MLAGDIRCVASKPAIEPSDGGLLDGWTSGTLDLTTAVVSGSGAAGFTIKTTGVAATHAIGKSGGLLVASSGPVAG